MEKNTIDIDDASLFLSGIEIFHDLDEVIIYDLAKNLKRQLFTPGQCLIKKGEPGKHMFIIKEGDILIDLDKGSLSLSKGTVVGEMALLSKDVSTANVFAKVETEAFTLSRCGFYDLMEIHKSLAVAMTELMQSRLQEDVTSIQAIGKYKVLNKLGEGGMSTVYCAYDPILDRNVAIKMLNYEIATDAQFKARFKKEAIIIAKLNHPNIMQIIEVIEAYSTNFIVMEKVEGVDLAHYVKQHGALTIEQTREVISQVALALEHAHQQHGSGIVHRDVKPSNIIMEKNGAVKLMDFGLAGSPEEMNGQMGGTANYMAPETLHEQYCSRNLRYL